MAKQTYEAKFENFIANNPDLIDNYEAIEGNVPVEYCVDDIIEGCQKLLKVDKTLDFNSALRDSFQNAIDNNISIVESFEALINLNSGGNVKNSTQQYFKEIHEIYNKHNNDYNIEYCPENREKLIEMNLKAVISIAKKYQGLGLTLQELISAGNLGLVIAYDKFDPHRSKLKDDILEAVESLPDEFECHDLYACVKQYMDYGDVHKKFMDHFQQGQKYLKTDVVKWINSNVYNAKFNSIATMWIRAYILIEIDNCSRIVKKPKSEIYRDREKFGAYKKETTVDIDAPINSNTETSFGDLMKIEDDTYSDLEVSEAYDIYKSTLIKLLDGVKPRDRSIFLKKFGIGLPRPMLPREIAEQEGLSIARISQIFQTVIDQIQINQVKYDIDPNILFEVVKKFR